MNIVTVNQENLEGEHICCAISNNRDAQVASKKAWLRERFDEGLVFKKGDVRGKVFIEYLPAEQAWCPIEAEGYMFIDCLWVSGQYKGQGISNLLLEECFEDSREKGKHGVVILSSEKKLPFLSDPKFLKFKGFLKADSAPPTYELLYYAFDENAEKPRFKACVKSGRISEPGFVLYYAHQCPFTVKYVPLLEQLAEAHGVPFRAIRFETGEQARNAPAPFTSYSLFCDGEFLTNEILSEKKFEKLLESRGC